MEAESGEVEPVGEVDEGEGEGWRVAGGEGARLWVGLRGAGTEGHDLWLVGEKEPFCLGGKVHRRTSWVEQALYWEGLL